MAFFDRMKDSLTTAGQEVSQKAKNATENVRLGNLIKNNDKMVDKLLYQVGLKYYEAHGQEEGTEYQELFAEINRLKSENAAYQQELDNLNSQIDEIQAAQSDLQEEMDAYDDQLMALLTDMDLLENDMDAKQDEIDQANADLEVAQEKEQTQYNAMKTRIQYMYENGDSNYWEQRASPTF